ncbi:MAG: hypothetical protein K0R83_1634 [Caulobacter sp.]|jgi:hypothetical protein|nr:hypothetical protein [Caulobacter sp.]
MPVYRSVHLVIQNSTPSALTVEAAEVIHGGWKSDFGLTAKGGNIPAQSAASLTCASEQLQIGCEGFIRLASTMGMVQLHWALPWVGRFRMERELNPRQFDYRLLIYEESPASPTALVTLSPGLPPRRKG